MRTVKKTIIVIAIILVALSLYLGAYLPFKKSSSFIRTISTLQSARDVNDLKFRFDRVLALGTPVASDEILGFFADQMFNIIRAKPPKEIGHEILSYAEAKLEPILKNENSPELTKIILKIGNIYQAGWLAYNEEEYFQKAESYYKEGLKVSPRRPQFLYGLFQLYLSIGDAPRAREVGAVILRFWPEDEAVQGVMKTLGVQL